MYQRRCTSRIAPTALHQPHCTSKHQRLQAQASTDNHINKRNQCKTAAQARTSRTTNFAESGPNSVSCSAPPNADSASPSPGEKPPPTTSPPTTTLTSSVSRSSAPSTSAAAPTPAPSAPATSFTARTNSTSSPPWSSPSIPGTSSPSAPPTTNP